MTPTHPNTLMTLYNHIDFKQTFGQYIQFK